MSKQMNAETIKAFRGSGLKNNSVPSFKEAGVKKEDKILSITDEQKKLLNIKDLTKWEELDTMGYAAQKERMGILIRSGINIARIL